MFTRIVHIKQNGKSYKYLRLIENSWENGKTVQKVVANFGNVDSLEVKKIDSAIASLLRYSSGHFKDLRKLKTLNVKHLGEILAGEKIYRELEIEQILQRCLNPNHLSNKAALLIKTMILSRLVEPLSKLALSKTYHRLALQGLEGQSFEPQHFYRAMDELILNQDNIEIALHERVKDLFSMNLNMVFYDLTSSYFEGEACSLAKHGYSRDHRSDREQIVIGLLVTDEGLPLAHQVYTGNTKDSNTLGGQIKALKKRFGVNQCIFVVDRGLVTEDNLTELVTEGYQYIVALRKRKRELFQPALAAGRIQLKPIEEQKELSGFETTLSEFGEDRVLFCFNPDKAEIESRHRKARLQKAETELKKIQQLYLTGKRKDKEKLLQQAARYLERKKLSRFFHLQTDTDMGISIALNQETADFEAELDGLFILRTNRKDLSISEIVKAYKTLARAESAFKELKDFIDLRPMRHWAPERVQAHIFICVLSYLIETCLEIKLNKTELQTTAREALDMLSEIKLVEQEIDNLKLCTYSQPSAEARKIITALGLILPKEKLLVE